MSKQSDREEAAALAIIKMLQEPWYSDIDGCRAMAYRILNIEGDDWHITIKKKPLKREGEE